MALNSSNAFKFTFQGDRGLLREEHGRLSCACGIPVRDPGAEPAPSSGPTGEGAQGGAMRAPGLAWRWCKSWCNSMFGNHDGGEPEGHGSTFIVHLPFGTAHPCRSTSETRSHWPPPPWESGVPEEASRWPRRRPCRPRDPPAGQRDTRGAGERPRVLLADDNTDMRTISAVPRAGLRGRGRGRARRGPWRWWRAVHRTWCR
jgi:hypothetical protein